MTARRADARLRGFNLSETVLLRDYDLSYQPFLKGYDLSKMTPQQLRLRQLDKALASVLPLRHFPPPKRGWIHAIRSALGLTTRQMAKRLKISQPAYRDSEVHESSGSISLAQLRRIADAIDCDLVYAVVPRRPLTQTVDRRAAELAQQRVRRVAHTMALEDQAAAPEVTKAQIATAKTELLSGRWSRLWE